MDTIRLRTLTYKSIIGFGKYAELSVAQIIALNQKSYLRYLYFCNENINFTDEILREINIVSNTYDERIKKPGTDKEKYKEIADMFYKGTVMNKAIKARQKAKNKASIERDKRKYSKASLTWRNQGH